MSLDRNKFGNEVGGDEVVMWPKKGAELAVGDSLEGVYTEKKVVKANNKDTNIYVLEQEDGTLKGVWGSAVLDKKFELIPVGAAVGIEYLGTKKGKQPMPYKDFYVATENGEVGKKPVADIPENDLPF